MIPTLQMIMLPLEKVQKRAQHLAQALTNIGDKRLSVQLIERSSKTGGGALPLIELPSLCIGIQIKGMSPNAIEKAIRSNNPPIIGRIEDDLFVMDPRTIQKDELPIIETAFKNLTGKA